MAKRFKPSMSKDNWIYGEFLKAISWGSQIQCKSKGWLYRGIALQRLFKGSPKGRRPATWNVTHLNSGHTIFRIHADEDRAFSIATDLAECGDWDFTGLHGYINSDPDLLNKTSAIAAAWGPKVIQSGAGGGQNEAAANAISYARS